MTSVNNVTEWLNRVERLNHDLSQADPFVGDVQTSVLNRLCRRVVRVAAIGNRSAGKSTSLNALLQRALLGMYDGKETGVPCYLRYGAREEAVVIWKDRPAEPIACEAEIIRRYTAVFDDDGEPNLETDRIERLVISLSSWPFPYELELIDVPGNNDKDVDFRRIDQVIDDADMILWVVVSDLQIGNLDERWRIKKVVDTKGTVGIVLVANAVITDGEEQDHIAQWKEFIEKMLPRRQEEVEGEARKLGLDSDGLKLIPFAALSQLLYGKKNDFGRETLQRYLSSFVSPESVSLPRARWHQALSALRGVKEQVAKVYRERIAYEERLATHEAVMGTWREQQRAFADDIEIAVLSVVDKCCRTLEAAANDVKNGIYPEPDLGSTARYSAPLNKAAQKARMDAAGRLFTWAGMQSQQLGCRQPDSRLRDVLARELDPPQMRVVVPEVKQVTWMERFFGGDEIQKNRVSAAITLIQRIDSEVEGTKNFWQSKKDSLRNILLREINIPPPRIEPSGDAPSPLPASYWHDVLEQVDSLLAAPLNGAYLKQLQDVIARNRSAQTSRPPQETNEGDSTMADDLITPENLSKELLKSIFDAALMDVTLDSDGDLIVRERYGCWLTPMTDRIEISTFLGFEPHATHLQKLEYANKVNQKYAIVSAFVSSDENSLIFNSYVQVKGGVTRRSIVFAVKKHPEIIASAFAELGTDIIK